MQNLERSEELYEDRFFVGALAVATQELTERQSFKRRIDPVDIANFAVFLSSRQADPISGQNIQCDGGR